MPSIAPGAAVGARTANVLDDDQLFMKSPRVGRHRRGVVDRVVSIINSGGAVTRRTPQQAATGITTRRKQDAPEPRVMNTAFADDTPAE